MRDETSECSKEIGGPEANELPIERGVSHSSHTIFAE